MHNHSNENDLPILMQIKLVSLTILEHQDSLRNRDKQQLGNGPFFLEHEAAPREIENNAYANSWGGGGGG